MKKILTALAASTIFITPAHAGVVFSDDFDAENGGASQLNYAGFANFDVEDGTVDIIKEPGFGLSCNTGSCVDLDGSTNDGGMLITQQIFSFSAGQLVSLSVDASGNQRGFADDNFDFGFRSIGADVMFNDRVVTFGSGPTINAGDFTGPESFGFLDLAQDRPFEQFVFSFTAGAAGSVKAFVRTSSADSVGPIVDNFSVSIGGVPEPTTWAFLIFGFGAIGGAMRSKNARKRSSVSTKVSYS